MEEVSREKEDSALSKMLTKKIDKTPTLAKKYLETLEHQGLRILLSWYRTRK